MTAWGRYWEKKLQLGDKHSPTWQQVNDPLSRFREKREQPKNGFKNIYLQANN